MFLKKIAFLLMVSWLFLEAQEFKLTEDLFMEYCQSRSFAKGTMMDIGDMEKTIAYAKLEAVKNLLKYFYGQYLEVVEHKDENGRSQLSYETIPNYTPNPRSELFLEYKYIEGRDYEYVKAALALGQPAKVNVYVRQSCNENSYEAFLEYSQEEYLAYKEAHKEDENEEESDTSELEPEVDEEIEIVLSDTQNKEEDQQVYVEKENQIQQHQLLELIQKQKIFSDAKSSIIWQFGYNDKINYLDANEYCKSLEWIGYTNWRLPTIFELRQLATSIYIWELNGNQNREYKKWLKFYQDEALNRNVAITDKEEETMLFLPKGFLDLNTFPNEKFRLWSKNISRYSKNKIRIVNFHNGRDGVALNSNNKKYYNYVACVSESKQRE